MLLAIVLLAPMTACGPADQNAGPPRAGDPLPDLGVLTLAGDSVRMSEYRGRPTVLNLWATWCQPCRAEMPFLQELADRYEDRGLVVVGLSVDDLRGREAMTRFLMETQIRYPILHDPSMESLDRLGILGLPATFLVDREGRVTDLRQGPVSEQDTIFVGKVEALLSSTNP